MLTLPVPPFVIFFICKDSHLLRLQVPRVHEELCVQWTVQQYSCMALTSQWIADQLTSQCQSHSHIIGK